MANMSGHAGVFITFEGGDGVGKSTHIRFLSDVLRAYGLEVVHVREPGGTSVGEQLRAIVLDIANNELTPEAELLIYEAARAQLVSEVIKPALERGAVVLCDRFTDSTLAYQGYGRGLSADFIKSANAFASAGITPDKTLLITCPDRAEKIDRVHRRDANDRLEVAGRRFHDTVEHAFDELAQHHPERIVCIDTSGLHSQAAQQIFSALADIFPWLVDGSFALDEMLEKYDRAHVHADGGES